MTHPLPVTARPRAMSVLVAALLGAGALGGAAQAATTTLTFGGSVSTVDSALTGTFQPGDAVSITLSYDPSTPDLIPPNPQRAGYGYISFDLKFGSYSVSFGTQFPNSVGVENDVNESLGPSDAFGASAFQTGAGPSVGGLPLQQGFVTLWDFTQTAFSDTSLPASPSFAAFSYRVAGLTFCSNSGCGVGSNMNTVFADISSMNSVPEPASAALMLAGVTLVAWRSRRRDD